MKKILALMLVFCTLLVLFCSCGTKGKITETENTATSISWGIENQAVRDEMDEIYNTKLAATKEFAQVSYTGTAYYISPNGNDGNDGKSPTKAWRNPSAVSQANLKAGDAVLFECGGTYRTCSTASGSQPSTNGIPTVSGVTYASYGTGAKPVILGSYNASGASAWEKVSDNLYVCKTTFSASYNDVGCIIFNGGEAWGIKIQRQATYNGGWTFLNQTLKLENVSNGLTTFTTIPSYSCKSGKDLKDYDLTFLHDTNGKIYVYSTGGNPGTRFKSVEIANAVSFFQGSNTNGLTVANLDLRNAGRMGVRTQDAKNLTVKNCSFSFIGGTVQSEYGTWRNYQTRLGNAVENWNSIDGMTVENCYFTQIYDTALTTQSNQNVNSSNVTYKNNVVDQVWFGVELWAGDSDVEHVAGDGKCRFDNVDVSGNYFRNLGSGFTSQRPDKAENGAGIEAFIKVSRGAYTVTNAQVVDNIIDGTTGRLVECAQLKTPENENGYLFDRNTYLGVASAKAITLQSAFPALTGKYGAGETHTAFTYRNVKELASKGFEPNGKFYCKTEGDSANVTGAYSQFFDAQMDVLPLYTYTASNKVEIPFRLIFPTNYDKANDYALITYLNVEKASGTDNVKNVSTANVLLGKIATDANAILLVPQCPEGTWTGLDVENGNYSTSSVKETDVMKAVSDLIADVAKEYKTTENLAVGCDAGAYGVADLLARHKNLLTKAIIVSGAGDASAKIGNAEVWIVHAEFDTTVSVDNARELKDAWGAKYTEYPRGVGHDCWGKLAEEEDLIGWLTE